MIFDTHCHLDTDAFDADREAVFARAYANEVTSFLNPAFDLASSQRACALAQARTDLVCAVGIHPNDIGALTDDALAQLQQLAQTAPSKVVAIGEIGLDYHWNTFAHAQQRAGFVRQLQLAQTLNLPVIIHCRDAYDDCLDVLAEHVSANTHILLHSFAGNTQHARIAAKRGYFIGLGGPITYKKAHETREIAAWFPADKIVLETDSPYLSPEPNRGKRNEPAHTRLVAQKLAELRGCTLEEIAHSTLTNAQRLFNLPR